MDKLQEEIDEIILKKLRDIERTLRANGISPKLCDWNSIENKVRQDVIEKYKNLPISVTCEQLSKFMPNENIISDSIESLQNATKALDVFSAKRVIHDALPTTIDPFLWDKKILRRQEMKPIIIVKEKNEKGNYEFTEKEFNDIVEQIYNNGLCDGKMQSQQIYIPQNPNKPQELFPWQQPWYCGVPENLNGTNAHIKEMN